MKNALPLMWKFLSITIWFSTITLLAACSNASFCCFCDGEFQLFQQPPSWYWAPDNNGVFTGVFSCWCVVCKDTGWAAYSQVRLHVTGEYNHQQAGISYQTTEHVACRPIYTQRVSLIVAHALAKGRNFERVASKTQHEYATAFSHLHKRCW